MDCYTATDVENQIVARMIRMNLDQFLNSETKRDGSDEETNKETTPVPVVRRNSMIGHWVELAKQEEDSSGSQWVEQAEPEEDPLGLEGLRRIRPKGGMDKEVEATTFSWSGLEGGAEEQRSTLSLPQLQLQLSASFQPSSSRSAGALLLQTINQGVSASHNQVASSHNQGVSASHNQGVSASHNQSLATSHNQGVSASHNQSLATSHNQGVSASHNQSLATSHNQGLSASHNQGLATSHNQGVSASHYQGLATNASNDIDIATVYVHPYPAKRNGPRLARSRSPTQLPTSSRFGDGCTSDLSQDNHPSCHGEENRSGSSWYNTDSSPGEVNPETSYNNWSTISNSDAVPPYQARINSGSASGFQISTCSASSNGPAPSFQASNGSASNFQVSTSHGAASSGLGYGFQPFSTGRNDDRTRSQSLGGGMRPTLVGQPGGPRSNGRRYSGPRSENGRRFCNFCKTNGESSDVYLDHSTGTPGAVTCPNLFKHSCEICGATGRNAHTRGYCPQRKNDSRPIVLELKGTQRKSDGSFR